MLPSNSQPQNSLPYNGPPVMTAPGDLPADVLSLINSIKSMAMKDGSWDSATNSSVHTPSSLQTFTATSELSSDYWGSPATTDIPQPLLTNYKPVYMPSQTDTSMSSVHYSNSEPMLHSDVLYDLDRSSQSINAAQYVIDQSVGPVNMPAAVEPTSFWIPSQHVPVVLKPRVVNPLLPTNISVQMGVAAPPVIMAPRSRRNSASSYAGVYNGPIRAAAHVAAPSLALQVCCCVRSYLHMLMQ